MRFEEAFGIIPGILLGSLLYAAYLVSYAMSANEMVFLGIMCSIAFRLTKNFLILWSIFPSMGQFVNPINEQLVLSPLAALGFIEALIVLFVLV